MIVAGCIVVLAAIVYFGMIRAPRGEKVAPPAQVAERPPDPWRGHPAPEVPVTHRVEHVHRIDWPDAPVPIDELTPAARRLLEGGGR